MNAGATIKRRPRRVASDEAHAWARNLRLGNDRAKTTLAALSQYVDGEGRCYVSIEQIADDTDLSADTVRRRLAWLDHIGAIVRIPQWIDENGRRNGDGRGKRTTDQIALLTEADPDEIEAKARGAESEFSPSSVQGLNDDASPSIQQGLNPVSPRLALGQPSQSCEGLISEPEPEPKEDSPLPPEDGGTRVDDGWEDFKREWLEPMQRPSLAQQVWRTLTVELQRRAPRAAKGYFTYQKSQGKKAPSTVSAQTFLRETLGWDRWETYAPAEPEKPADMVFEAEGSPSWRARLVIAAIAGTTPPKALTGVGGKRFQKSLNEAELALAQFADGDPEKWPLRKDGTNECGAWKRFLGIEAREIKIGVRRYEYLPGKWNDAWPIRESGLRTPIPFPPLKDGTISTGPPDTLLTDQDVQDLKELGKMTG